MRYCRSDQVDFIFIRTGLGNLDLIPCAFMSDFRIRTGWIDQDFPAGERIQLRFPVLIRKLPAEYPDQGIASALPA